MRFSWLWIGWPGMLSIPKVCVFFTQQLPEKSRHGLWEGRFFVA